MDLVELIFKEGTKVFGLGNTIVNQTNGAHTSVSSAVGYVQEVDNKEIGLYPFRDWR